MARTPDHPFQLAAVQVLGELPASPAVDRMLRQLLDSEETSGRLEAYRVLARNEDSSVFSTVVTEENQKFILDVVPSQADPIIYATRTGKPRIAIIGRMPQVVRPLVFSALNNRLTISARGPASPLTIFYRDPLLADPVKMFSNPDVSEVIRRLGGDAAPGEAPLNFSYGQIVAMLLGLSTQNALAEQHDGQVAMAPFVLQEPPQIEQITTTAPPVDTGRPIKDSDAQSSQAEPSADDAALANSHPQ
jgi:hypothetical protein